MHNIKEISVFTIGDSTKFSTWSNLPFFFTEALIKKNGIKINRVDISPNPILNKIFNLTVTKVIRLFFARTTYNYFRSSIHFYDARFRIKKAIKKYKNSEMNIFLTFSFSAIGFSKLPNIQFCDWTYEYYLKNFENKKVDFLERKGIKREDSQIKGADFLFLFFASITDYMKERYKNDNTFYFGKVINNIRQPDYYRIMKKKSKSDHLIFIGDKKYLSGAQTLIKASDILRKKYPELEIDIVALNKVDFEYLPPGINCYGYLDKGNKEDVELFYSLIERAKIFVNTTPKMGAFAASIEAMFFYTPIIVTPYNDFVETFGMNIPFGYYCEINEVELLCEKISKILEHTSYNSLSLNAHEAVKEYTWDACINNMLERINN